MSETAKPNFVIQTPTGFFKGFDTVAREPGFCAEPQVAHHFAQRVWAENYVRDTKLRHMACKIIPYIPSYSPPVMASVNDIDVYRLRTLRAAVKLEKVGLRRRGKSAKSIVIGELRLPIRSTYEAVIEALDALIPEPRTDR